MRAPYVLGSSVWAGACARSPEFSTASVDNMVEKLAMAVRKRALSVECPVG